MRTLTLLAATVLGLFLATAPALATAPTCVQGTAGVAPVATLTFSAPSTNTDGTAIATPITYDIFEGTSSGGETLAAKGVSGSPVTINSGLKDGTSLYVYIEVVDANGALSAPSNEACKSFPAGVPGAVTITIT